MTSKLLKVGITCYPTFGGSGVIATEIGIELAKRGHQVHFISSDIPMRLRQERFAANIFYHEIEIQNYPVFMHPPYTLGLASKMVEVCTYEGLDILHVHYAVPHATSAYLARQILGKQAPKIITTLHGTDITLVGSDRSYFPIARFSIVESDGVTVPSQYLRNATYDKLGVPSAKAIEVIPNFVDPTIFRPAECHAARQSVGKVFKRCPDTDFVLAHVSNFREVKQVPHVIEIFDRIQKVLPARLVLVGDGPERSKVERLVHDRGLTDKVSFLGKQLVFVEVLQAADLFLLPSSSESFGLSALEAMACGVPVIASDVQGIPEVVTNGENGFLCEVGDVDQMAAKAITLLKDDEMHARFSKNAHKRAISDFSEDKQVSAYEAYYHKILSAP